MSHSRYKIEYFQEGAYGSTEKGTLYMDMNCSCDYTTFYDETGDAIFSFPDTLDGNIFEKMIEIYKTSHKENTNKKEITGFELDEVIKKSRLRNNDKHHNL